MCMSCGCVLDGTGTPDDDHGGPGNITLTDLACAAKAGGDLTIPQAAANIVASVMAAETVMDPEIFKSADTPQRYCLGIAYQAGRRPEIARGQDGGRDFLTAQEIEKSAWEFLSNGPRVGLFHLDGTETGPDGEATATVVESYIWRGPDWDLGNGLVAKSGDWLLGAVLSPKAWDLYQRGQITGWSPQGVARRRKFSPTA
jgi:hypothetical protein